MEKAASKGMGRVKSVKAALTGLRGVFRTLAEQHGELTTLLERAKTASDPEKRSDLWTTIREELLSHERAEANEIFPILRSMPATKQLADRHDGEVREIEELVRRIDGTDFATGTWSDLVGDLADMVEHHVKEEENETFPRAQDALGRERTRSLEEPFLAEKERIASAIADL